MFRTLKFVFPAFAVPVFSFGFSRFVRFCHFLFPLE